MFFIRKRKIYFKLEENADIDSERILVVCFHLEQVVMVERENGLGFPVVEVDEKVAHEKQIQRSMYEEYGVLIKQSKMLGNMHLEGGVFPVFVSTALSIESATPFGIIKPFELIEIGEICDKLKAEFWQSFKKYFLYHIYKVYREITKSDRENLVRKEFFSNY